MSDNSLFPNAATVTVLIPANSSVPLYIGGSTIGVISTTAAFKCRMNNGTATIELDNGLTYECPDDIKFSLVELINETGGAITAKLFIGQGRIRDARLTIQNSSVLNIQNQVGTLLNVSDERTIQAQGAVTITTTSTAIGAAVASTTEWMLYNAGTVTAYIAFNSTATVANGWPLEPGEKMSIRSTAAPKAICASGSTSIKYVRLDQVTA